MRSSSFWLRGQNTPEMDNRFFLALLNLELVAMLFC